MIFGTVGKILGGYKDVDPSTITADATFASLELDSLDTVEIVMSLEDAFGIEIDMEQPLQTVEDLVKLIEAKKA